MNLIVCAEETKPLKPGSVAGYNCEACKKPLQVTKFGLERMKQSCSKLYCNDCGMAIAEALRKSGNIASAEIGPAALEQFARMNYQHKRRN